MTVTEFLKELNENSDRRELFRTEPVRVVAEAELTIGDIMKIMSEHLDKLQNQTLEDYKAITLLLEHIANEGEKSSQN
ncbi:MAG: hypothetical protein JW881_18815 [Spirochaetales bacterium]|nr:hypothetical protein [Spirochaetales bacterium]